MKTIIIFAVAFLFSASYVQAQKAGRVDNMQHPAYYPCPYKATDRKRNMTVRRIITEFTNEI